MAAIYLGLNVLRPFACIYNDGTDDTMIANECVSLLWLLFGLDSSLIYCQWNQRRSIIVQI